MDVGLVLPGDTQLLFLADGPWSPRVLAGEQVLCLSSALLPGLSAGEEGEGAVAA